MHKRMFSSSLSKAVVGFQSEIRKSFAATELKAFAKLSDDHNPLHFDESFAKTTRFKQPIVHGMLVSSLFSGLIATQWPGNAIYLKQDLKFKAPVFVNEEIKAKFVSFICSKNGL